MGRRPVSTPFFEISASRGALWPTPRRRKRARNPKRRAHNASLRSEFTHCHRKRVPKPTSPVAARLPREPRGRPPQRDRLGGTPGYGSRQPGPPLRPAAGLRQTLSGALGPSASLGTRPSGDHRPVGCAGSDMTPHRRSAQSLGRKVCPTR
jgi:hypothetical protein